MILKRPIITFDTETTGISTTEDRIIQIAAIKKFPDGTVEEKNYRINLKTTYP